MNEGITETSYNLKAKQCYHGTRADLKPGDLIKPDQPLHVGKH